MIQICGTATKGDNKQVVDWFAWDERANKSKEFSIWVEKVSRGSVKGLTGPFSDLEVQYIIWNRERQGIYTETVAVFMNDYKQIKIK